MFRQLDYQDRVLNTLDIYIDHLVVEKRRADEIAELSASQPHLQLPELDFSQCAWEKMKTEGKLPISRADIPFSPRSYGCGHPVPNVVLKVPTGGGKTWLAVSSVSHIMGRYLDRNTGFVLWVVPNEAIYSQTLRRLRDRQHPYREALDRTAAGHVRIMEKTDRLDARDVDKNLCIMLLMLQSANRQTKDSLKMFQDRGDVHGFFPSEGNQQAHGAVLDQTPNLASYGDMFPMVKDSLGNALRIIRPVVVLDEGQRATSDLAFKTLYDFNPCFVLELTATPKDVKPRGGRNPRPGRYANLLVDVTGRELDDEGMIKMPLNLDPRQGTNWRTTLEAALNKLEALESDARQHQANTNQYIRPIMLVQVERTGADQRESGRIHAEDVKEWLLVAGFDEAEIAIKTAEQNDLNQPENQDLLSPMNQVRVIITKQALQEGWDCPFAYVLCALAASTDQQALTQLVGRILRQPYATKTNIATLDECYIVTHHAETASVVQVIKDGLEQDGLGDLIVKVAQDDPGESENRTHRVNRRPAFKSTNIYLPKVMTVDGGEVRELDYETDILSRIDWRGFDPKNIADIIPENAQAAESQFQRIGIARNGDETFIKELVSESDEMLTFDPIYTVRMIMDIVPNLFVGREIVGRLLAALYDRGFDEEKLGKLATLITNTLYKELEKERDTRAETQFKDDVAAARIQFRLRLDGRNWRMPFKIEATEPDRPRQLVNKAGGPLERSLFTPIYEADFNNDERNVAVYLDGEETLTWWFRNVARSQYSIQGWKKGKIYPDFIFAVRADGKTNRIVVLETKGDQLENNLDTEYKRKILSFLSDNFAWDDCTSAGELKLVKNNGEIVQCTLLLMSEWPTELPEYL